MTSPDFISVWPCVFTGPVNLKSDETGPCTAFIQDHSGNPILGNNSLSLYVCKLINSYATFCNVPTVFFISC